MEEVIFKLAGGNIPKGIYQNVHCKFHIKKTFLAGRVCLIGILVCLVRLYGICPKAPQNIIKTPFYDICDMIKSIMKNNNLGIKRTVSIRQIDLKALESSKRNKI